MASSLIFRLKAATKFEVVRFEGSTIKAFDAKVLIAARIGCSDLEIDLYKDDVLLKGKEDLSTSTQVEVVRTLPSSRIKPLSEIQKQARKLEDAQRILSAGSTFSNGLTSSNGGVSAGNDEEERLRALKAASRDVGSAQATTGFTGFRRPYNAVTNLDAIRPPPPGYICHACGKGGHFIEHCPESGRSDGKRYSLPVGIAESNLQRVDAKDPSAKFVTKDGHWVKRRVDGSAFITAGVCDENDAPSDIKCPICTKVFVNAMKRGCCGAALCSPCLDAIVDKSVEAEEPPTCTECGEIFMAMEASEDTELRNRVDDWKNSARAKRPRDDDR
jgi:hypothetical protein